MYGSLNLPLGALNLEFHHAICLIYENHVQLCTELVLGPWQNCADQQSPQVQGQQN